jgi:hypothetical protein
MTNISNLFNFIESNRPEYKTPLIVKFIYNPESLTKDDLNVKGDLDLSDTSITTLPNGLTVGDDLNLFNTPITTLPDNLTVGGGLDLYGTPITTLPDNLRVEGYLNLSKTSITTLPDNLIVVGDLYLSHTPLSKQYSEDEIRKMIQDKGGNFEGYIYV